MGIHLVGCVPPAELRVEEAGPFRGHRLNTARGAPPVLTCHPGGRDRTVEDCEMCARFLRVSDGPRPGEVSVTCAWSDRDPVSALMSDASALVFVHPRTSCDDADLLARRHSIGHLLVVQFNALVGVLSRKDLVPGETPVVKVMATEIFAIDPTASLGAALGAMRTFRISCLPVVADGFLVGVITRADLRRVGVHP
jgi:signal-transduction protein with cAMP-binding, CBS, and nucleotidyltransferase domain